MDDEVAQLQHAAHGWWVESQRLAGALDIKQLEVENWQTCAAELAAQLEQKKLEYNILLQMVRPPA